MFRAVSLLGLLGIAAAAVWAVRSGLVPFSDTKQALLKQSREAAGRLRHWRALSAPERLRALMRFFYLATLFSVLILAVTGFVPVIFGQAVVNFALILHLVLAPLFAIGITALALFWAQRHRFNEQDWKQMQQELKGGPRRAALAQPNVWQKACFWLSVLLAVPVIVSTVLMMSPLYGTAGQEWLLHLHGYAGMLLLIVAVLHAYSVLPRKPH